MSLILSSLRGSPQFPQLLQFLEWPRSLCSPPLRLCPRREHPRSRQLPRNRRRRGCLRGIQ